MGKIKSFEQWERELIRVQRFKQDVQLRTNNTTKLHGGIGTAKQMQLDYAKIHSMDL